MLLLGASLSSLNAERAAKRATKAAVKAAKSAFNEKMNSWMRRLRLGGDLGPAPLSPNECDDDAEGEDPAPDAELAGDMESWIRRLRPFQGEGEGDDEPPSGGLGGFGGGGGGVVV